jgi:hypothetical protein
MTDTDQRDRGRADLIVRLHETRQQHTDDAARMLTVAETGTCGCGEDDDCECPEWDRGVALEAARTYALLAQAAVGEMAALIQWWDRPAA